MGKGEETLEGAIKKATSQIPVEEQSIADFLNRDVFTDPKFKQNKLRAEKLLSPRFEEVKERDNVTGAKAGKNDAPA